MEDLSAHFWLSSSSSFFFGWKEGAVDFMGRILQRWAAWEEVEVLPFGTSWVAS